MTLDSLVTDMVNAAARYPGINLIWYRSAVETTAAIVSIFMGIAWFALVIGMPVILAIELIFLNFPPMTAALVEREDMSTEKKRRSWGLFVNDARKALRAQAEKGGSINAVYFGIKWKSLAAVTGVLNILFFGGDAITRFVTRVCGVLLETISR
ncbi:hypothetical protein FACS1894208_00260 [Clostridia bacterium]|nr:hypothetical protein FACS1894208_00260 [Clostridia bacterium]